MSAKEKLIRIVECAKGDDLERAERAFRGMTYEQLKQQHGMSGQTRLQVLEYYRAERAEWQAAYDLARSMK